MAKRRGPLGQLFIGFILLLIVAAGAGVGLAVFYEDDAFAAQLRTAGVPEPQIAKAMELKGTIKSKADFSGDDLGFTARSIWWDLRDRFDMDLTAQYTQNLPPVRHVTQMEPMARADDPTEPASEAKVPEDKAGDDKLPPDLQREGGEQAGAPSDAPAMTDKPATESMSQEPPMAPPPAEEKPMVEAAPEQPMAPPEPPPPAATDKPMALANPPAEEAKPEPAPPATETAAVPEPAAPVEAPPATVEERQATADLTYKRALSLFADAKTQDQKAEAAKLFAQAAIGGHPGAQYSIGVMHYNGTGVAKDYAKAAEWFGRSAEKNNAAAQYNLGILYYNGQGVPKDDRLAYKWISAAAENGDQKAIVARDALKQALPADITKPEAPTFPGGLPAGSPLEIAPAK
ncbi:MAG: tetratricopeptide repeat protein [Rhodospirillales bacterium]